MISIKTIDEILKHNLVLSDETYINLSELLRYLERNGGEIRPEDCVISPIYICDGKRYELYQYDCTISLNGDSFEKFLLHLTGRSNLSSIPGGIIKLRRVCYIDSADTAQERLKDWIAALFEDSSVRDEVLKIFGAFNKAKIYAAIY